MEENNLQDTQSTESNQKKKGNGLVVILVIIILALVAYICYDKLIADNKESNTTTEESNKTENKKEEGKNDEANTELTDATKIELKKKVATLLKSSNEYKDGEAFSTINNDELMKNTLSDDYKIESILLSLEGKKSTLTVNDIKVTNTAVLNEMKDSISSITEYTKEEVSKKFKGLYGTDAPVGDFDSIGCGRYFYDLNSNKYLNITLNNCGVGGGGPEYLFYVDDVVKVDEKTVNVNAYVGTILWVLTGEKEKEYYNDYYFEDESTNLKEVAEYESITNTNKTRFTKYSFTFEKSSDGNYYYKSVSKA